MQGDLTTLANVEQYLSLQAGNQDEGLLSALISAVSGFFVTYCGRQFVSQTFTEIRNGTGGLRMPFANPPATAVASLQVGTETIPAGNPFAGTRGYSFTPTMLVLNGYRFCRGAANVMITYTGGFTSIPLDLEQACKEQVALRYKELSHFDVSSKAMAGETTGFVTKDMKPSTLTVLERYKRVVPAS